MGRNLNNRLTQLEQRCPARGHVCEVVKVRADGTEEGFSSFWTFHPVTKIRVVYKPLAVPFGDEKVRKPIDTESSSNPGNLVDRVGD